jgi:hypothetical protein
MSNKSTNQPSSLDALLDHCPSVGHQGSTQSNHYGYSGSVKSIWEQKIPILAVIAMEMILRTPFPVTGHIRSRTRIPHRSQESIDVMNQVLD